MKVQEIISLMKAVSDYGMTELKLDDGTMKLSLRKEAVIQEAVEKQPVILAAPVGNEETMQRAEVSFSSDQVVASPLVGTFYSAPSPDADDFVKVGDTVKKGQVLGIIEAMKLMNEIESDFDGVVEAILVKNEEVVEYGQPLFRIKIGRAHV